MYPIFQKAYMFWPVSVSYGIVNRAKRPGDVTIMVLDKDYMERDTEAFPVSYGWTISREVCFHMAQPQTTKWRK